MGCFISTGKKPSPPSKPRTTTATSKSPPPEEETVKEILTEFKTPITPKPHPITHNHSPFIKTAPLLHDYTKRHRNGVVSSFADDESSDISESFSLSTNATEKRETHEEVRQKSPAKLRNRSIPGERPAGKSPGRVRSGCGYVRRNENGESSGRRSRSPVPRSNSGSANPGLGRVPSGRKTGKSPSRVGSGLGDRTRKMEDGEGKWPPTTSNNELIENPLVSLECFIFL